MWTCAYRFLNLYNYGIFNFHTPCDWVPIWKAQIYFEHSKISVLRHIQQSHIVLFIELTRNNCIGEYIYIYILLYWAVGMSALFISFSVCEFNPIYNFNMLFHIIVVFDLIKRLLIFTSYYVIGANFVVSFFFSYDHTSEIGRVPMASLFLWKFFESFNTQCYS